MGLTSRLIPAGDRNAGAQPRAVGWHYEVGEEADHFQIQRQCSEYVYPQPVCFLAFAAIVFLMIFV